MNDEKNMINTSQDADLGFEVVGNDAISSEKIIAPRYSYWKSVFRVFFRKKSNILLISLFVLMILSAVFIPLICKYDPVENVTNASSYNLSPAKAMEKFGTSFKWLLGTGPQGNSIMYNIFAGARTSLFLAVVCAAINMTIGIILGAVWGFSKKLDAILIPISTSLRTCRSSSSLPFLSTSSAPASGTWYSL